MPSDDIVALLRECTCVPHGEICREAADEIERLRKAIAHWSQADQEWLNIDVPTAAAMEKLRVAERKLRDAAGIRLPIQGDRQFDGVTE